MKRFYDRLAAQVEGEYFAFMNYGYAEPGRGRYAWLQERDRPNRYHLSLVRRVLEGVDLCGKSVLEVGCGRGGNCDYLLLYTAASRVTGVDLCAANARLASRRCNSASCSFVCGDAQRLPFRDASFDVVLNVESSHCYPSMERFVNETWRVLRPSGVFAHTDFWRLAIFEYDWDARERAIRDPRFEWLGEENISEQVFLALKRRDGISTALRRLRNAENRELIGNVVRTNDALRYYLASGQCSYLIRRLRKR